MEHKKGGELSAGHLEDVRPPAQFSIARAARARPLIASAVVGSTAETTSA